MDAARIMRKIDAIVDNHKSRLKNYSDEGSSTIEVQIDRTMQDVKNEIRHLLKKELAGTG